VTLVISGSAGVFTAQMVSHGGRAHNWANKTHTRSFIDGFQLYPTLKLFLLHLITDQIARKIDKKLPQNKLERFVKEEL
jgi:hypothetical protein